MPWPLNQATARLRKPITVGFCSSASTSTYASRVAYVDGDMDLVVADAVGAPLLPITGDPVADLTEPGQGLYVHVDQVARPLPLVPLHRRPRLQSPQSTQTQAAEDPGHGGEGSLQR